MRRPHSGGRSSPRAARRRRQAHLVRVLAFAAVVAFFTGTTAFHMREAVRAGEARPAPSQDDAFIGLRGWLAGETSRRRSLAERWPGAAELAARGLDTSLRDPGAQGVQLYGQWWLIGAGAAAGV